MNKNNIFIATCGPLASGKTTLAKLISENFGYFLITEDLRTNLYFSEFYSNMKKWGFHIAVNFLIRAFEVDFNVKETLLKKSVCQDWYHQEHHKIYNQNMYMNSILTRKELELCKRLNELLIQIALDPDLLIYLHVDSETLKDRIRSRSRPEEVSGIGSKYLEGLISQYEIWINSVSIPLLIINANSIDFSSNENDKVQILNEIENHIKDL